MMHTAGPGGSRPSNWICRTGFKPKSEYFWPFVHRLGKIWCGETVGINSCCREIIIYYLHEISFIQIVAPLLDWNWECQNRRTSAYIKNWIMTITGLMTLLPQLSASAMNNTWYTNDCISIRRSIRHLLPKYTCSGCVQNVDNWSS